MACNSSNEMHETGIQPPKKSKVEMELIIKMLPYSAMKIAANSTEAYSTLLPATSSASASIKSNGVRLVSADEVITKSNHIGNSGSIYQICI